MIASNYKDIDGFKLQFEEDCPKEDKEFFVKQYPKVDTVADKKLHCTTCDFHIGTAPISEKVIRTHLILGVTQCNKCFAFYNSGEFGKGEDGSEYYCRWCGQGGEVFCCSTCPFVFCNKCIRSNLSNAYVKEIEENDDWSCFVCNKDILKNQRAQHWALRNFMNKQLEKIQRTNVTSEDELNNLLNEDVSNCCPRKKRKPIVKPPPAPVKRPSMNGGYMNIAPPAKKPHIQPTATKARTPQMQYRSYKTLPIRAQSVAQKTGQKPKDDIVCTPDIMGLFNNDNDDSAIPTTNMMPSTSVAPPPLVMRNNQRPTVRTIQPNPIYHNVNGFQIDLNHASRQEIFRLPNGKLIQVRKQTTPAPSSNITIRPGTIIAPRGPQFTIRQAAPTPTLQTTARMFRPQTSHSRIRANGQPQQRFTFSDGRVLSTPIIPPAPVQATPPMPPVSTSTIFTQQNGSISVARAPQPDTPFGRSKTEFEDKIISGMEICQHTINKMITLSNSTSFKTSRSFSDLKDLYIHLQYLFTYTSGKFTTLQESLKTGMESLTQYDEKLKEKCDEDELEIVEQKTDIIEVMSDDEEEATAAKSQKPGPVCSKKPQFKHIQYQSESSEKANVAHLPGLSITPVFDDKIAHDESSNSSSLSNDIAKVVATDKKLSNKVLVKVEKLEDTKNPIIKEFVLKLQKRSELQAACDSSREATPDIVTNAVVKETVAAVESIGGEKNSVFTDNEFATETETENEVVESENNEEPMEVSDEADSASNVRDKPTGTDCEVISIDIDDDEDETSIGKVHNTLEEITNVDTNQKAAENSSEEIKDKEPADKTTEKNENVTGEKKSIEESFEKTFETSEKIVSVEENSKVTEEDVTNASEKYQKAETLKVPEESEAAKDTEETKVSKEAELTTDSVNVEATKTHKQAQLSSPSLKVYTEEPEPMKAFEKVETSMEQELQESEKDEEIVQKPIDTETAGSSATVDNFKDQVESTKISQIAPVAKNIDKSIVEIIGSSQESLDDVTTTSIVSLASTVELDNEEMFEEKSEPNLIESPTGSTSITSTQETSDNMINEAENFIGDTCNEPKIPFEKKSVISAAEEETIFNDLIDTLSHESLMEID